MARLGLLLSGASREEEEEVEEESSGSAADASGEYIGAISMESPRSFPSCESTEFSEARVNTCLSQSCGSGLLNNLRVERRLNSETDQQNTLVRLRRDSI